MAGFAWATLAFMVLVVLWGAVVRATSSGGGCGANWPLCNGDFFPHHPRLTTMIEFTHRSMSGICTILVAALVAWTFYGTERNHRARRTVVWAGLLLVTEALLGAALVLLHYVESNASLGRVIMQSIHFTNTMLLLAALSLTAWFLSSERRIPLRSEESLKLSAWLAFTATIVVGATGSLAALADTLFPSDSLRVGFAQDFATHSPLIVRMRWLHPAAALIAVACTILLATRLPSRISQTVLWLALSQILLGALDVVLLAATWIQVVHLLGADLYWIALCCLTAEALWPADCTLNQSNEQARLG